MNWEHREQIPAVIDDEEVTIYNEISVTQRHYVNSVNGHETFEPILRSGDGAVPPEYVTERIAEYLYAEFGIDQLSRMGITAVDPDSDGVELI